MSLVRWDPFEEWGMLRRAMDRLLEDVLTPRRAPSEGAGMAWEPPVDMYETDTEVVIRAALPHIDPKSLDVTVTQDTVTIRAETRSEQDEKGRTYYRRELRYGTFTRILELPAEVKGEGAKATYKDGVLEVRVPKSERAKPTSVKVQVA